VGQNGWIKVTNPAGAGVSDAYTCRDAIFADVLNGNFPTPLILTTVLRTSKTIIVENRIVGGCRLLAVQRNCEDECKEA
jgi:hypothetical protein